jgi:general secretion pathway protein M
MKQWWQGLNKREQTLVIAMSVAVFIMLFVTMVWQPLNTNLANAQKDILKKQELLTWVRTNTAKFAGQATTASANPNSGSLTSIVNNTAKQWKISVSRMQPKGEELQVWLEDVPFNDFLAWAEHLYTKQGVLIKSADIAAANVSGFVKVNRLELGKS